MPTAVQKQILRLDISMGHTHRVEILDTLENLLETAFDLAARHAPLFNSGIEITAGAVLHNLAPVVRLVLNKVDSFHDVRVVQRG